METKKKVTTKVRELQVRITRLNVYNHHVYSLSIDGEGGLYWARFDYHLFPLSSLSRIARWAAKNYTPDFEVTVSKADRKL